MKLNQGPLAPKSKNLTLCHGATLAHVHFLKILFVLLNSLCGWGVYVCVCVYVLKPHSDISDLLSPLFYFSDSSIIESIITLIHTLSKSRFTSRTDNPNKHKQHQEVQAQTDEGGVINDDGDQNDIQEKGTSIGGKLPAGSGHLIFGICMRLLDYLTKM